jgi:hypothetical protein
MLRVFPDIKQQIRRGVGLQLALLDDVNVVVVVAVPPSLTADATRCRRRVERCSYVVPTPKRSWNHKFGLKK